MPVGSSPILPLSWAPTGLKYLKSDTFHSGSDSHRSLKICSIVSFVCPYGFVAESSDVSVRGDSEGFPYTVADELNTIRFTPCLFITLQRLIVPVTLFS